MNEKKLEDHRLLALLHRAMTCDRPNGSERYRWTCPGWTVFLHDNDVIKIQETGGPGHGRIEPPKGGWEMNRVPFDTYLDNRGVECA